jgi:hypothetical protein
MRSYIRLRTHFVLSRCRIPLSLYTLTTCSRVLAQKLTVSQPVKKFTLYRTQRYQYLVHNSQPLLPILRHINTVYAIPPCYSKIHCSINLPFMQRSLSGLFHLLPSKTLYTFLSYSTCTICPIHLI